MPSTAEPRPRTRLPSAGLLFLVIVLVVVPGGSLAVWMKVRAQRALVGTIGFGGGNNVTFGREFGGRWLRHRLNQDWMTGLDPIVRITWHSATNESFEKLRICGHLRELNLVNSDVTDGGLVHLSSLTELEILTLDATEVTGDGLRHLKRLHRLRHLSLSATGVTDRGLESLADLASLDTLNLHTTDVSDDGLAEIAKVRSLQWLSLGRTPITDDGLRKLSGMPSLKSLFLDVTRVSDDAVREFEAANPACRIYR
jgi:hypothetical protein